MAAQVRAGHAGAAIGMLAAPVRTMVLLQQRLEQGVRTAFNVWQPGGVALLFELFYSILSGPADRIPEALPAWKQEQRAAGRW